MVQAVALRGSAARAWLISLSASSTRLVDKLAAARSTCASATSSNSRDLRENLAASGYAASKRRNFPISRSPRATIFSLAAAAAGKSPASLAEFAAANRRSNSSSGDAGFCCALACRHPRTASRKRPRADRLQRMTFEDREGRVWIKAECPRLVPKSTRLVASCSRSRDLARNRDFTQNTHLTGSMSSIKRDVKKKVLPRPEARCFLEIQPTGIRLPWRSVTCAHSDKRSLDS